MDHLAGTPAPQERLHHQDTAIKTSEARLDVAETEQQDDLFPGRKRKHDSFEDDQTKDQRLKVPISDDGDVDDNTPNSSERPKKPKLELADKSRLPMEIWHHIFSFLDPQTLGTLLRINRTFHSFLTSTDRWPLDSSTQGVLKPVSSNSIWSLSRKLFHPGMPRPLDKMTELGMWKLIGRNSCDTCGKEDLVTMLSPNSSAWERGPGDNGVRIFWPFRIRTCSECFLRHTKRDVDVVLSSLPTCLLPGLSFVLMTPAMHLISSVVLRSNTQASVDVTKYYSNADMADLMQEFDQVKSLGPATLEEWIKGLESKGKRKMADAARWEQWENSGGLHELRRRCHERIDNSDPRSNHDAMVNEICRPNDPFPSLSSIPGLDAPSTSPGSIDNSIFKSQSRSERSLRDVDEAKASRRAEIERRCLALHPPITAAVLSHMESFSAAIQIPHELNDKDWEYLKPRLLAQREMAEKKEIERLQESQLLMAKTEERRQQEARYKQEKEFLDHQWEDAQRLIHDQINLYADEVIEKSGKGSSLTKDKCAQFAADVLMHVRNRFYAHIQEEDAVARASGVDVKSDSPNEPPTRKLILENMKWVFDTKIKPLTEKFTKDLFLCNGCENNTRMYGFEGVVQHYAAKHTTALSSGNVIVYWRAEWPEKPPFHPNPNAAKALLHATSQGGFGQPHGYRHQGAAGIYMGTPEQRHGILADSNSSRTYGRSPFRSPYTTYMHGPFQPPSPRTSPYYPGYVFPPPSPAMEPSAFESSSAYGSPYHTHVVPVNYQGHLPQAPHAYPSPVYQSTSPANQGLLYKVPHNGNRNTFPHHRDAQQTQLDHMARVAREVWNALSGIKDIPNSVRAHVLIYHVAYSTQHQFNTDASITLFADGLNNHPQMKPMRSLNGLVCGCCKDGRSQSSKTYGFSALLSHFQSMHMEHVKGDSIVNLEKNASPDWKIDMIELPDLSSLKSLLQHLGRDDFKLRIIAQALPEAFPSVVPALPPETFMTKRSPAMCQAVVAERQPNYHSPTLQNAKTEEYSSPSGQRVVPMEGVSESVRFSSDTLARRDSPNAVLRDDGRSYIRSEHYVARSPRTVILRSPRYIRVQDDWVYRDHDADEVGSDRHDKYYIPVSTRSALSDRSDYPYKQASSEQFEQEMPIQQRIERQANLSRQGQSSDGSARLNNATPRTAEHDDSRSNAGDLTAAEKFLNNFVLEQEVQYPKDSANPDIRNTDPTAVSVPTHERPWRPVVTGGDDVPERASAGLAYYSPDEWKRWGSPGLTRVHEVLVPREGRAEWTAAAAAAASQRTRSPDVVQLRYGRKLSGAVESKLPPSRFDRYEALRQESRRVRSRSPSIVREDVPARDVLYFEDQDPRLQQQSRLPPQHMSDAPHRYSSARLERENSSMSNSARRNAAGYRAADVREPAYYDDSMEY